MKDLVECFNTLVEASKKGELVKKLSKQPGVRDPEALAAWIGKRMGGIEAQKEKEPEPKKKGGLAGAKEDLKAFKKTTIWSHDDEGNPKHPERGFVSPDGEFVIRRHMSHGNTDRESGGEEWVAASNDDYSTPLTRRTFPSPEHALQGYRFHKHLNP